MAIMFIEWPQGTFHVSLRSKENIDASQIALKFGGGGHARAAGCSRTDGTLEGLMRDVIGEAEGAIEAAFSE